MKLICIGDSLTYGYGMPRAVCWSALFARESGWETVNRGINGDTTGGMLARLRADALDPARQGDCRVLVMGGSNDIFFSGGDGAARANITAICHQLAAAGCAPLLGVPLPVDWPRAPDKWAGVVDFQRAALQMAGYCDWLRRFAACCGLDTVDFFRDFVRPSGQPRHELFLDGVHPNEDGHREMARRLGGALLPGWASV